MRFILKTSEVRPFNSATLVCCEQINVAGTPCRPSVNPCDLPEYCGGTTPFCPSDFYMMDGLPCANNAAFCFEGRCQTFDYQCKQLFGSGTPHWSDFYLFILGDLMSLSVCQNAVNLQMTSFFKFYTMLVFSVSLAIQRQLKQMISALVMLILLAIRLGTVDTLGLQRNLVTSSEYLI